MKYDLLFAFETLLDEEAKRITRKIIDLYYDRTKVHESYGDLVKRFLSKEFEYYFSEIEMRTYKFLPDKVVPDITHQYALVNEFEANVLHLDKYSKYCAEKENKNHKDAAKKLANILIDFVISNPASKASLVELISSNMNLLFPRHNDSVDSRAIVLYLQTEFEKKGYTVLSISPFKIQKNYQS